MFEKDYVPRLRVRNTVRTVPRYLIPHVGTRFLLLDLDRMQVIAGDDASAPPPPDPGVEAPPPVQVPGLIAFAHFAISSLD